MAADRSPSAAAGASEKKSHEFTALIADDQPDMLKFISSELSAHYNIVAVSDGQQAVDKAAVCGPDIVLLDMMMPEKDGLQACREIRAAPETRAVPIILITAHVDEETKLNALRAGASDFLPKPFSTTELHVRVRNLVDSLEFQRKLARQNQVLESTIDHLKETESQLVQSEKLASLGRLSAGIIHEINNPLNFVTTGLFTLRGKARLLPDVERDDYAEILKDVEEGIIRVKSIVTDLRTFTHPGGLEVDAVNVAEAVNSSLRLLSQEWKGRVEVRVDLTSGQVVWAEKNRLIQVLINLLQNSLDAVRNKAFPEGRPLIEIIGSVDDQVSKLVVRDNGEGIDSKVMDKVFDPFFTTKDVGQGMGLGLSICYRIVRDFGGRISVRSELGNYCEFTLEFPAKPADSVLQP
jgi:C4-dicarboxylate-specific signal transduction histidine kinase